MTDYSDGAPRTCLVCDSPRVASTLELEESMTRTGDRFAYQQCADCWSLTLASVPDLTTFYGSSARQFYSSSSRAQLLRAPLLRTRGIQALLRANTKMYLRTGLGRGVTWAKEAGLRPNQRILDLGCGDGESLLHLSLYGFKRLAGADPFAEDDYLLPGRIPVRRASHMELEGEHDWVLLNHAFEHVPDPRNLLASLRRLLSPTGHALVRMPVLGGKAWRIYGRDWVQLDPPRHVALYTLRGFQRMLADEGFLIERVFYDSTSFQFWGSELVRRRVPLAAGAGAFAPEELRVWSRQADVLNRQGDGDQAGFVIRPLRAGHGRRRCDGQRQGTGR